MACVGTVFRGPKHYPCHPPRFSPDPRSLGTLFLLVRLEVTILGAQVTERGRYGRPFQGQNSILPNKTLFANAQLTALSENEVRIYQLGPR